MPKGFLVLDRASAFVLGAWLAFALWATCVFYTGGNPGIYSEGGPIENIQSCLLAIACGLYLVRAAEKRSDRLILLACALLCYGFVLRELDVEDFDIPGALKWIGSRAVRNATVAMGFTAIFLYAALTGLSRHGRCAMRFIRSRSGLLLATAGFFLLVGEFMESSKPWSAHPFLEEMAELMAYVLILLSTMAANSHLSRLGKNRGP